MSCDSPHAALGVAGSPRNAGEPPERNLCFVDEPVARGRVPHWAGAP